MTLGCVMRCAKTDSFVASLRDGCAQNGHTLVLLSDHGQELVTGTIPLMRLLQKSGVPQADFNYYCELACARLWFNTDRARTAIIPKLQRSAKLPLATFQ